MHARRMIPNDRFFREIWTHDITVTNIALIYGTSRAAIYRAASRFKIGGRHVVPEVEIPRPQGYEAQLLWSKGRWSILRDIADTYGRNMTQVQADFHRARANERRVADRGLAQECARTG